MKVYVVIVNCDPERQDECDRLLDVYETYEGAVKAGEAFFVQHPSYEYILNEYESWKKEEGDVLSFAEWLQIDIPWMIIQEREVLK